MLNMSPFFTASLLLLLVSTQGLEDGGCCYESLLLPTGVTDFDIQAHCPVECIQCHDNAYFIFSVTWHDEQGRHGIASRNTDDTYRVWLHYPIFPGHYNVSITYEYQCISGNDPGSFFTTLKTLNVYGANMIHYQDELSGISNFSCSTGVTGAVNSGLTMNMTFTGDDNNTCSAICDKQQEVSCDWDNMEWIESDGTCTVILNSTTSNLGTFCCEVNSQVITCEHVSATNDRTTEDRHSSKPPGIIIGSAIGGTCLLLVILIVIGIAVLYRRRPTPYKRHHSVSDKSGEPGEPGDGGRLEDSIRNCN